MALLIDLLSPIHSVFSMDLIFLMENSNGELCQMEYPNDITFIRKQEEAAAAKIIQQQRKLIVNFRKKFSLKQNAPKQQDQLTDQQVIDRYREKNEVSRYPGKKFVNLLKNTPLIDYLKNPLKQHGCKTEPINVIGSGHTGIWTLSFYGEKLEKANGAEFIIKAFLPVGYVINELKNLKFVNDGPLRNIGWLSRYYKAKQAKKCLNADRAYLASLPRICLTEGFYEEKGNCVVLLHKAKALHIDCKEDKLIYFFVAKSIAALHRYFADDLRKSLEKMRTFCHGDCHDGNVLFDETKGDTYLIDNGSFADPCKLLNNQLKFSKYLLRKNKSIKGIFLTKEDCILDKGLKKISPLYDIIYYLMRLRKFLSSSVECNLKLKLEAEIAEKLRQSFINGYVSSFPEGRQIHFRQEINEVYAGVQQLLSISEKYKNDNKI
jgi:hypothetical protein